MNERSIPALPCMCANLRRASRALTQIYDEALRPLGLRTTQFTVLQAFTRTLAIMSRHCWIAKRYGKDRRERRLSLTKSGEAQLNRATPSWEKVQARLRGQLGDKHWNNLMHLTHEIASAFTQ
jgi:hypothetical protein